MNDPVFYTIPEAAERLGVSKNWLRAQLASKPPRFRHRRIGNRYEMSDEHIAEAHTALEVSPETAPDAPDELSAAAVSRRRTA